MSDINPIHSPFSILFVCTGNVCRSPLARMRAEQRVLESDSNGLLRIDSAGIRAPEGAGFDERMAAAARRLGVDVSAHSARRLSAEDLATADLVVYFERAHAAPISALLPSASLRMISFGALVAVAEMGAGWPDRPPAGAVRERAELLLSRRVRVPHPPLASDWDVPDPIGRSRRTYRRSAERIVTGVDALTRYLTES